MSKDNRKQEEYREMALRALKAVKAIEFCKCERMYRIKSDCDYAFKYGTAEVKREFQGEKIDFDLLHDEMKNILDEAAPNNAKCDYCEA